MLGIMEIPCMLGVQIYFGAISQERAIQAMVRILSECGWFRRSASLEKCAWSYQGLLDSTIFGDHQLPKPDLCRFHILYV